MTVREISVKERITRIVAELLGAERDEVTPSARLVEDLGADSLDTVELIMAFEQEFGLEISDNDADAIVTVADIHAYIERRQPASAQAGGPED